MKTGSWTKFLCIAFLLHVGSAHGQQHTYDFFVGQGEKGILLTLHSREAFPCMGYSIVATFFRDSDTLVINVRGFMQPTPCIQGLDIARGKIMLYSIDLTRPFFLKFRGDEAEDVWKVVYTESKFRTTPLSRSFTYFSGSSPNE